MNNLNTWLKIGKKNVWIKEAYDPDFNLKSFSECTTINELVENFTDKCWCLGQAFYYQNICFIQQVDGGDEWLVIKDDYAFESWSCDLMIKRDIFEHQLNCVLQATKEQCLSLTYLKQ
jgi:hypothetical protein